MAFSWQFLAVSPLLTAAFEIAPAITKSRVVSGREGPAIVVTEGSDSFFSVRKLVQDLHDFGRPQKITPFASDAAKTKKALLTRQARYSGLTDVLDCRDGSLADAMAGANVWLAMNADEAELPVQIKAAKAAGVERAFVFISATNTADFDDVSAVTRQLAESGMKFTIMRTGDLVTADESGSGLKIGDVDQPVCEAVSAEDVFRFVTESLTLPEAEGRAFSLCPSKDSSQLKQMRLCGYERRDEVRALLKGCITEVGEAEIVESEKDPEMVLRSAAEVEAERAEELKTLLSRAKARGEENQRKAKLAEEEKVRIREEQQKYYSKPPSE